MDVAWIQIFVLTIAECVAPAGKTVCQESEFDLQFLTRADCEFALQQLVSLKAESANVIVDESKSHCAPSARQAGVFASLSAVSKAAIDKSAWQDPDVEESPTATQALHQERLADLLTCEESAGVAPCKLDGVIIEEATQGKKVEIWRREQ